VKKNYSIGLAIFCCFLFLAVSAFGAEKILTIGSLCTTSGPAASLGKSSLNGAQMAADDINAKGGITVAGEKYKIKIINYDDKCVAKDAVSATERLVSQDKVPVILGAICSHCTLAAMEITEKEKIPIVCAISASTKITAMGYKYIFRTAATAGHQMEAIVRYAAVDLKKKKGFFIGRNDAWSRSSADEFKSRLEKRGGTVVGTEFYELGSTDFYPQLTKAKNADPDFIFFCALAEDGGLLFKQAKEMGIKAQLMAATFDDKELALAGPAAMEGALAYYEGGPSTPEEAAYEKRYNEKFSGNKSLSFDKLNYDALMVIAKAFEKAGTITDGQKIRDALSKTNYKGFIRQYTFLENGQAKVPLWIVAIEKGKRKFVKFINVYDNPAAPF
jgi:branched-chain amino acid transport system substrate-binding protein